jgi:TolB protein
LGAAAAFVGLLSCGGGHTTSQASGVASSGSGPARDEPARILWMNGVENAYPRWSNDGRRILFQSNRGGKWQIYVMNADGSYQQRITDGRANDNLPDWSPDNQSIAFVSDRDGNEDVYVMRMDRSALRDLSHHAARDIHPYWSHDGRHILFNSDRAVGRFQVYSVRPDGTDLKRLTDSPDDQTCARLSPAGDRMVYLANLVEGRDDVIVADSLGGHPQNVTNDAAPDGWPTWTPDGARIVYASQAAGRFALYSMKPDGSDVRRITRPETPWSDARPCVSPDMRRIVFNRERDGTIGIYVTPLEP